MGTFTTFYIKVSLKKEISDILNCWTSFDIYDKEKSVFKKYQLNFNHIFCNKYYEDSNIYEFKGSLKNYYNDIENFLIWVNPYIEDPKRTKIGWWKKEDEVEESIYVGDDFLNRKIWDVIINSSDCPYHNWPCWNEGMTCCKILFDQEIEDLDKVICSMKNCPKKEDI